MPAEYTGGISEAGVKNLKEFVNNGGMLICFDNACDLAIKEFNLPLRNVLEGVRSSEFYCPGSIFSLELDNKHSIAADVAGNTACLFHQQLGIFCRGRRKRPRYRAIREGERADERVVAR